MRLQLPDKLQFFLTQRAPYKGAYGGRGGAKTETCAAAAVLLMTQLPLGILCCREIQKSIKDSVKKAIDDKIVEFELQDRFISTRDEVVSDLGGRVSFSGLRDNATSIRSRKGDQIIWVEEANTVSAGSLEILLPTLRTPWPDGGDPEFWFTWNPRFAKDPVDKLLRTADCPPGSIVRKVNYYDNPFFPGVLQRRMAWDKERDPDKYKHVWLGEYASMSSARVFKNWTNGVVDNIPKGARPYYGIDFGFAQSPTVANRVWIIPDRNILYVDREVSRLECPIAQTADLLMQLDGDYAPNGGIKSWPSRADSARPETIRHLRDHGFPSVKGAKKGPGSVIEGVQFIKSFDVVIHPNCKFTTDNFVLYSWELDKHTNEVLPKLADGNDDHIDAIRYAIEDERRSESMVGAHTQTVEKRPWDENTIGLERKNPALGDGHGTRDVNLTGLEHLGIRK